MRRRNISWEDKTDAGPSPRAWGIHGLASERDGAELAPEKDLTTPGRAVVEKQSPRRRIGAGLVAGKSRKG